MVQQDVVFADCGEDILRLAGFHGGDLTIRRGDERRVLQIRAIDLAQFEQNLEVQRRRQTVHLVRGDPQLGCQQLGKERTRRVRELQANRRSEAAAQQLSLHRVE